MPDKPVAAGKSSFDLIDVQKTLPLLLPDEGGTLLDLACGPGDYSLAMADKMRECGRVIALDLWEQGIAALRRTTAVQGIANLEARVTDIRKPLPLMQNSIDSSLLATVLHDLEGEEQGHVLAQLSNVLKGGGLLNVIEFKKVAEGPGPPLRIRLAEEDIDRLAADCGFQKVQSAEIGNYNYLVQYRLVQ